MIVTVKDKVWMNEYFRGVFAAYLGYGFMNGPISEWQIETIKENISRFNEAKIDHSQLSPQEKEEQKCQMKKSLEVYIQGVKDEMKAKGEDGIDIGLDENT